jgi:hypothetical protein
MDFSGDTNVPTGAIQHETSKFVFQKWNGSAWTSLNLVLANAAWLQWRNAADNAGLDVMRVDSSNNTEINAVTGQSVQILVNGVQQAQFSGSGLSYFNTTTQRNGALSSLDFDGNSVGGYGTNDTGSVNGAVYHGFLSGGTFRGSITNNSNTAVAYNTTSDHRLKEDVEEMGDSALEDVLAMRPVSFKWKGTEQLSDGFIAHELAMVVPHAVTGTKDAVTAEGDPIYQGVDASFLIGRLVKSIQILEARVAALENV